MDSRVSEPAYTIVVGVDGLPAGQAALLWAVKEARAHNGSIRVVHAWTSPYDWQIEVTVPPDETRLRREAQGRLDKALSGVDTRGVEFQAKLVEGDPRRVLLDAAREADLLVVGSDGCGPIREILLGSVSSYCAHHASGPVVVVHTGRRSARSQRSRPITASP